MLSIEGFGCRVAEQRTGCRGMASSARCGGLMARPGGDDGQPGREEIGERA